MVASAFALTVSAGLRVASLDLCADEYLLTVARDSEIAAVSRLSQDAAESRLAPRARQFGSYRGHLESLVPVHPDLLLAVGSVGGRSILTIAEKLGWKVLVLPYPASPADVGRNLARVASALGDPARATPWRHRFARLVPPAVLSDAVFLSGGGQSVDPDGLSASWMRLAGLRQRSLPGGRMTLEQLVLNPPSVLLRSDYRTGQLSLGQRWLDHPLVRHSAARQLRTDGRAWTCGGPLMLDEIERLATKR